MTDQCSLPIIRVRGGAAGGKFSPEIQEHQLYTRAALGTHLESNLGVIPGVGFTKDGSSLLIAGVTKLWLNLQGRNSHGGGAASSQGARMAAATEASDHVRCCPAPTTL